MLASPKACAYAPVTVLPSPKALAWLPLTVFWLPYALLEPLALVIELP